MSVYVDDMRLSASVKHIAKARWSHLVADSVEELHAFAASIGLKQGWFQDRPGFPHYDVTDRLRSRAIRAGALPVSWREMADRAFATKSEEGMREKHEMLRLLKELGQDMPEFQDHADAAAKELDKLIDSAATTRAEKARQATETHLIARIRHEVARAERAARERDEALSREASLCDLLNTWARESNVEEAERQEEAKAVADRLWAHVSDKANVLRRERDELRFALEYLAESGMTAQNMKKYARLAALDSGSERSEGEKRAAFAMGSRSPRQVGGPDQPRARNSADQLPANSGPGGAAAAAATPSGEAGQDAPGAAASTEGSD